MLESIQRPQNKKKKIYALPLGHACNITWDVYSIYVASSVTVLEKLLIEI